MQPYVLPVWEFYFLPATRHLWEVVGWVVGLLVMQVQGLVPLAPLPKAEGRRGIQCRVCDSAQSAYRRPAWEKQRSAYAP